MVLLGERDTIQVENFFELREFFLSFIEDVKRNRQPRDQEINRKKRTIRREKTNEENEEGI